MKKEAIENPEKPGLLAKFAFLLLLLCSIHFWDLALFPPLGNVYNFAVYLPAGVCMLLVWNKKEAGFKYAILVFLIGLVVNFIASAVNLNQSVYESFFSFSFFYFILLYFVLHFLKLQRAFLENLILVFAVIYALVFIAQYKLFPTNLFNTNVQTAKGERQFEILGHGFLMLGYFLALNRYLINRKIVYAGIAVLLILVQFKCGFRTLVGAAILITFFMIIRLIKLTPRDFALIFALLFVAAAFSQYPAVSHTIDKMISKTQENVKQGDDYVRNVEIEYYYKVYPRNFSYYLIGGGKPAGRNLYIYDYNMASAHLNFNIVWVDIGLLGFYIVIGGFALFGMLWWVFRAIFIKLPRNAFYLSFYFLYLFLASFTNEEIFRDGIFSVHALSLYLIDLGSREQKISSGANTELVQ